MIYDHNNAQYLASQLLEIGFELTKPCETNMVWVHSKSFGKSVQEMSDILEKHGIRIMKGNGYESRLVLHHQISRLAIEKTIEILSSIK